MQIRIPIGNIAKEDILAQSKIGLKFDEETQEIILPIGAEEIEARVRDDITDARAFCWSYEIPHFPRHGRATVTFFRRTASYPWTS